MVVDASGRRKYVCLRCGNIYWSRAKKPQCPICKSKRAMDYEEFLKLPKEEQDKILGKKSEAKESAMKVNLEVPKVETESEVKEILSEEEPKEVEEKREEKPKVEKKSESLKVKSGEKAKGEKVKRGIPIPKPRIGLGLKALAVGMALVYILYKLGFFESLINHLKTLGVFAKSKPKEEVEVESNPLLERVNKNLSG